MRCILVSDADLKADARCSHCNKLIGNHYARKIGTRFLYCGYDCYQSAEEAANLARHLPSNTGSTTWKVNS
jgi:hypothetical protein